MEQNDLDAINQSVRDTSKRVRDQLSMLSDNQTVLQDRLARLLSTMEDFQRNNGIKKSQGQIAELRQQSRHFTKLNAFRFTLTDTLRELKDATQIQAEASRILGEFLDANRVAYEEVQGEDIIIHKDYVDGVASMKGRFRQTDFGTTIISALQKGESVTIVDITTHLGLSENVRETFAALNACSMIAVPYLRAGEWVAALSVYSSEPRDWATDDVKLVEETAQRIWYAIERSYTETALRDSESKYRTLFESIDQGFALIEMIFDADEKPLDYRFIEVNPAFERQTGLVNATGKRMRELAPLHEQHWFDIYGQVALTGESIRFENPANELNRIYDVYAFRTGNPQDRIVAILFNDITERKRREENSAFLASFSERMASLNSEAEIMRVFGEEAYRFFGSTTAAFVAINEQKDEALINYEWHMDDGPRLSGKYKLLDYVTAHYRDLMAAGIATVIRDATTDIHIGDPDNLSSLRIGSFVNVPLIRDGEWRFALGVYCEKPYDWRDDQIALLVEITNRIWNKLERVRAEEALRESETKFRTLFESMDEGYILVDMSYDAEDNPTDILYVDANPAAVKLTGTELVGKTAREVDPNFESHWYTIFGRVAKTGKGERHELQAAPLDAWYNVYVFKVGGPESRRIAAIYQDITERKLSEVLTKQRAALDAYIVTLGDALKTLTDPQLIQAEATHILGQHLKASRVHYGEITDDDIFVVLEGNYVDGVQPLAGRYGLRDTSPTMLKTLMAGEELIAPDIAHDTQFSKKERTAYAAIEVGAQMAVPLVKLGRLVAGLSVHQKTPRQWTAEEIAVIEETAERTWSAVTHARQVQQAQELAVLKDRQDIARDLHDAVTQTLFSASVMSESALRLWEVNRERVPALLKDMNAQVKGALAEMRTLLLELRPTNLQNVAFSQLIRQLTTAVQTRKNIDIGLTFDGEPSLPPKVHVELYRVMQEAINNIVKHSRADHVWVRERGGQGYIELHIRDNGVGFSTDNPASGMGLTIMRERAKAVEARIEIQSHDGEGTDIYLIWPRTMISQLYEE